MKIAIHPQSGSFSDRWIPYCETRKIPYKLVNCYESDIIRQMSDCDALMWHFYHAGAKDVKFAKQLLYSLQAAGKKVFPDFHTMWHFDDKVGQKYLLEAIGAPLVPSDVFYSKKKAHEWARKTIYPKVFKLRVGAGSDNVRLVLTKSDAFRLINKAFSHGFPQYDPLSGLKERWRKFRLGRGSALSVLKGVVRFVYPTDYSHMAGREKGYVYFQDFIPENNHDIRVVVIGDKAFAIKRMVRENDFRASGSGNILYEKEHFDDDTIDLAFKVAEKLQSQCVAFDFLSFNGKPVIVEMSYGFAPAGYDPCTGYWDKNLTWFPGSFNPYGWMVEEMLKVK